MKNPQDDSLSAVLRRRANSLREEGYNEDFLRVFERAAVKLDKPNIDWHKLEDYSPPLKEIEAGLKESDIVLVRVLDRYMNQPRMATGYLHMPFPYTIGDSHQPGWWLDDGDTWVSVNEVTHWAEINEPDFSGG